MEIRIAARGSRLSLIQAGMLAEHLLRVYPRLTVIFRRVVTTGDRHADKPIHLIGSKGVFEKEVNLAVLRGEADLAVHSLKDVPSSVNPRLVLAAVLPRDPPYDALVSRRSVDSIDELPSGAIVGTSSARRRAMLLNYRRDLRVKPIRGNVDTRLRKLHRGEYDALILAEAGLRRLGVTGYARIPPSIIMPAPCQGIVAAYARRGDRDAVRLASSINHRETMVEARAERAFLARIGGGCNVPVGCLAKVIDGRLVFSASLLDADGRRRFDVRLEGSPSSPESLGVRAAEILREKSRVQG